MDFNFFSKYYIKFYFISEWQSRENWIKLKQI